MNSCRRWGKNPAYIPRTEPRLLRILTPSADIMQIDNAWVNVCIPDTLMCVYSSSHTGRNNKCIRSYLVHFNLRSDQRTCGNKSDRQSRPINAGSLCDAQPDAICLTLLAWFTGETFEWLIESLLRLNNKMQLEFRLVEPVQAITWWK